MRRVIGYVLFTLGLTLLFLVPLMRLYVLPRVEKAPTDVYNVSISDGVGRYFSISEGFAYVGPRPVRNTSISKGDPEASEAAGVEAGDEENVAVIDRFSHTVDLTAGDIEIDQVRYVMNRRTGEAIDCCGADPPQEGHTLKFPFNVERDGSYLFWDSTTEQAFPAEYVRDEVIEGLDTYVFTVDVPATKIGDLNLPGKVAGQPDVPSVPTERMYSATYTLWVQTYTGAILKGAQVVDQWAQDPATGALVARLAHLSLENTPATVANTASEINDKIVQLNIVKFILPVYGLIAGILLTVIGFVLIRPPRQAAVRSGPELAAARAG